MYPFEQVVKEDGVGIPRIRTPQQNDVGFLNLPVGTRPAAKSEDCRQTDDAGSVSGTVTAIDVVAANHRARELLSEIVDLVGSFRATEQTEGVWPALLHRITQACGDSIESLVPTGWSEFAIHSH